MSHLMGNKMSTVVSGSCGPFTCLDNQAAFDDNFGKETIILSISPLQKSMLLRDQVDEFVDACKLYVFMAACRNYYVGVVAKRSPTSKHHMWHVNQFVG